MNEFIISFRESLEAALIVGIILTVLIRNGNRSLIKIVWISVVTALVLSAVLGVGIHRYITSRGDDSIEALLEGILMYLTAGLLFYVIFWMRKNLISQKEIERKTTVAASGGAWGIFLLVLFAILREGFETAIFLVASSSMDAGFSYLGFFGGMLLAIAIGYLIVIQGQRISLRKFFSVTSFLLVLFAAGMVAYGTHELHEYAEHMEGEKHGAYEEEEVGKVYDIFQSIPAEEGSPSFWYRQDGDKLVHILNDKGKVGVFFKGLFGYNSDPIWIEVILWFLTLAFGLYFWRRMYR